MKHRTPHILLLIYLAVFTICAISPYDRAVWWAENIPIMLIVTVLALTYRNYQFSNISYLLMSVLIIMHTIGGHYSFERVPFDLVTQSFGFVRNHYDRFAHFSVGFYAYPVAEVLLVNALVRSKLVLVLFPIFAIVSVAGGYEIIEWLYAVSADASAGIAVLGSQGDTWDAQKDMLADTLGAFTVMLLFLRVYRNELSGVKTNTNDN